MSLQSYVIIDFSFFFTFACAKPTTSSKNRATTAATAKVQNPSLSHDILPQVRPLGRRMRNHLQCCVQQHNRGDNKRRGELAGDREMCNTECVSAEKPKLQFQFLQFDDEAKIPRYFCYYKVAEAYKCLFIAVRSESGKGENTS